MKNRQPFDLYELVQTEAILDRLSESDIYFENKVRRWYSSTFSVTIPQTHSLAWSFILQQYFEDLVEKADHNKIFDIATQQILPEFKEQHEKEIMEFEKSLLEEQEESMNKKKAKKKAKEGPKEEEGKPMNQIFKEINMNFDDTYEDTPDKGNL